MPLHLDLVKYEQFVDVIDGAAVMYRPIQFFGAAPLLARQPGGFKIVTQTGQATAWRKKFNPPAALFAARLIEPPRSTVRRVSPDEWETSWQYVMAVDGATAVDQIAAARYPATATYTEIT